ncbi:hypothetical protein [Mariniluteicoccus flavus]
MHFAGPTPRRVSSLVAAVVVAVTATSCGAAGEPPALPTASPGPTRSPAPTPAQGGATLAQLGFANGPRDFALPAAVRVDQRVDQSNVVTLVMTAPAGAELARWVREQAYAGGWTVTADGGDAVVFHRAETQGPGWNAAFTGGDPSGLTFRRQPA